MEELKSLENRDHIENTNLHYGIVLEERASILTKGMGLRIAEGCGTLRN